MDVDVVIFGGGVAGLWLLDELIRREFSAVLCEANTLGSGQTVASQGILHGGLKYTLQGRMTNSALGIRDMPAVWRDCLAGKRTPDLTGTRIRSPHCYLWRTESMTSRLGMIGAKFGLRVAPKSLNQNERPEVLSSCPGTVAVLEEPVIAPDSFIADFASQHRQHLLKIFMDDGLSFEVSEPGHIHTIKLNAPDSEQSLHLKSRHVVFTAGAGNEKLRERAGLKTPAMQRRPLHMVLLRGNLPELNGHCVDGRKTRVTITSDVDSQSRRIWQIGGQVSERGVSMDAEQLIAHTRAELMNVIPGIDFTGAEWATYRVDRAEGITRNQRRPETICVRHEGNTITAWPTKLVLAPQLAMTVAEKISQGCSSTHPLSEQDLFRLNEWSKPGVALPPWEALTNWITDAQFSGKDEIAA
ncbi:MAG: FAD-dependent oxidoreductase [Planctomycetaceae bacterium]